MTPTYRDVPGGRRLIHVLRATPFDQLKRVPVLDCLGAGAGVGTGAPGTDVETLVGALDGMMFGFVAEAPGRDDGGVVVVVVVFAGGVVVAVAGSGVVVVVVELLPNAASMFCLNWFPVCLAWPVPLISWLLMAVPLALFARTALFAICRVRLACAWAASEAFSICDSVPLTTFPPCCAASVTCVCPLVMPDASVSFASVCPAVSPVDALPCRAPCLLENAPAAFFWTA